MKHIFIFSASVLFLFSCGDAEEVKNEKEPEVVVEDQTTSFDDTKFQDPKHMKLLKELDICVMADSLGIMAECSPQNFQIIPFKKNTPIEDAFILEMKSGIRLKNSPTPLPPVRHVVVFERSEGSLVKVNGFRGDIIATQNGEKADDLIMALYLTADETLFHCLYRWDGERYVFSSVEGLDYGEGVRVLSEDSKDSMTQVIYNDIIQSNLIY